MALRAFTHGYTISLTYHSISPYTDTSDLPGKLHWDPEDDKKEALEMDRS